MCQKQGDLNMIQSIGVDIVENDRFSSFLDCERKLKKILSSAELNTYSKISLNKRKLEYLASRFAAKEALYKAGLRDTFTDVSILNNDDGSPYVVCSEDLDIKISISHNNSMSIAMVIINSKRQE